MDKLPEFMLEPNMAMVTLPELLFQLFVGLLLSLLIRWHFKKYAAVLTYKEELGMVFPFILFTTLLVITVVKSSLALSLGLVGALSIVRFRTPIKEPEELAYLFLSIACGLGLGANQVAPTAVAVFFILGVMAVLKHRAASTQSPTHILLSVHVKSTEDDSSKLPDLEKMNDVILNYMELADLRKFNITSAGAHFTYFVNAKSVGILSNLANDIRSQYETAEITFIDQPKIPGL